MQRFASADAIEDFIDAHLGHGEAASGPLCSLLGRLGLDEDRRAVAGADFENLVHVISRLSGARMAPVDQLGINPARLSSAMKAGILPSITNRQRKVTMKKMPVPKAHQREARRKRILELRAMGYSMKETGALLKPPCTAQSVLQVLKRIEARDTK